MFDNMFRPPIMPGCVARSCSTILAMLIGVVLGIVIAVMRLSPNPVLSGVAWLYTWFFRAVPRLVLLRCSSATSASCGRSSDWVCPFDKQLGGLFGINDLSCGSSALTRATLLTGFTAGMLALALSEAAYMAEIVRAGMQSVDQGQTEAAEALGMSRGQTLRRVVLPQAMRVIIPPTGNETIAMLKDTSLLSLRAGDGRAVLSARCGGKRTFQIFPMYVAACCGTCS